MEKTIQMPARVYVSKKSMNLVDEGYPNSVEYVNGEDYRRLFEKNVALASRNAELEKRLEAVEPRIYNDDINF